MPSAAVTPSLLIAMLRLVQTDRTVSAGEHMRIQMNPVVNRDCASETQEHSTTAAVVHATVDRSNWNVTYLFHTVHLHSDRLTASLVSATRRILVSSRDWHPRHVLNTFEGPRGRHDC